MVILDLRQLETIKPGNLVRVDPGNSTVTVLEEVLDNETSTGGVKVALPSGLPHLEAVIAGDCRCNPSQ